MKKKLIAMILIVVTSIILCIFKFPRVNKVKYMRDINDTEIFVDHEENVLYSWYQNGSGAGMTFMQQSKGLPKLYNKEAYKYQVPLKYPRDIAKTTIFVDYEDMVMYTCYEKEDGVGLSVMLTEEGYSKIYDSATSIYNNVKDLSECKVLVDEETKIMYVWYESEKGGDISVMLNSQGLPKLYDEFTSTYTNIEYLTEEMFFMDESTKIMYIWYECEKGAGLTVRLNIDGNPKSQSRFSLKYMMKNIIDTKIFVDYEEDVKYLWCRGIRSGGFSVMPNIELK